MNAAAGLLTTLVNVITSQSGELSVMALATLIVTGTIFLISLVLFLIFKFWKLQKVIEFNELQHFYSLPNLGLDWIKNIYLTIILKPAKSRRGLRHELR